MAEKSANGPWYGSFFSALYDSEVNGWDFRRPARQSLSLFLLGERHIVAEPSAVNDDESFDNKKKAVRLGQQIKALVKHDPSIQPVKDILPGLARVSEAVLRSTNRHSSTRGSLLAFGRISDRGLQRPSQIAAFPTGPTGSNVRFVQVQSQRQGWDDTRHAWIEVPVLSGEEAEWTGPGASVEALKFSNTADRGSNNLAIRLPTRMVFLSPILERSVTDTRPRLQLNPLYELPIEATGNFPHSDVVFHPDHSRTCAVVDQASQWSLWKLAYPDPEKATKVCADSLQTWQEGGAAAVVADGWARIVWVCDAGVVAVCNRATLKLFDVSDNPPSHVATLHNERSMTSEWLLDMCVLPTRWNILFLLTANHLTVFNISRELNGRIAWKMSIRIPHHRNPDDFSLRLRAFQVNEDVHIVLHSDSIKAVVCYTLQWNESLHVSVGDATALYGDDSSRAESAREDLKDLYLAPVHYGRLPDKDVIDASATKLEALGVKFLSLVTLHKNYSVSHTLAASTSHHESTTQIDTPSWSKPFIKSASRAFDDEFVVGDDVEVIEDQDRLTEPVSSFVSRRIEQAEAIPSDAWTINNEHTARLLNDLDPSEVTELDLVLDAARDELRQTEGGVSAPWKTLHDYAAGEVTVFDLARAAARLEDLQLSVEPTSKRPTTDVEVGMEAVLDERRLTMQHIPMPVSLASPAAESPFEAFNQLVANLSGEPASQDLPELVQSSQKHRKRQMAAQLALAGHVVRPQLPVEEPAVPVPDPSQSQSKSQSQIWELALRPTGLPLSQALYSDPVSQTNTLPTPSATSSSSGPRSTTTASTYSSTAFSSALTHLSNYTTLSRPPRITSLPRRINRVLAHWTPGTDPLSYDYRTTTRSLSRSREYEAGDGEEMTEKEQLRLQRRAERLLRRQRREAEESQRLQTLSSQAPTVVSLSQGQQSLPVKIEGSGAMSQQVGTLAGSSQGGFSQSQRGASQVLPGRHGGRPPPRKKRREGF